MTYNSNKSNTYDAIVVGSGISGGWAAMELCKKGLKTLLLERGKDVKHINDYSTANLNPWDFEFRFNNTTEDRLRDPVQSKYYNPENKHFFVSDSDHPYVQERPFDWVRGYQVGGRSLIWGRQCYRLSDLDFEANLKDGIAVDWPIRYKDIKPWYDYVETFIGVSGKNERLQHFPDGKYQPPMNLNCIEKHLAESIKKNEDRILTIARVANLTKPLKNRGQCLNRNMCTRGCPYGAYFSTNSSTLPAAMATGNLTLRPFSIVSEIIYNPDSNSATGVKVIDMLSKDQLVFYSKIIFINASTIATASLLLNSKSQRFPNGLGNDCGELGHNLMDHHSCAGAYGVHQGFSDQYYRGRRPCGFLIPRYVNVHDNDAKFVRGYNIQGHGERREWLDQSKWLSGFGSDFKKSLTTPGPWTIWMAGWGECLPYHDNEIKLDTNEKDKWDLPIIRVNFSYRDNEKAMMEHIEDSSVRMLKQAGFEMVNGFNYNKPGGSTIHEMGTARMGHDPSSSVLNKHNQIHSVKNVFVTDGSCMTSSSCNNPSLTYMALTARACDYAFKELKRGNLR